jgi:hypothetical protein
MITVFRSTEQTQIKPQQMNILFSKNNIWLTTDYSFYKLNPTQQTLVSYNMPLGMVNSSFEFNNFYPLHDGRWLTATTTEVIAFKPEHISNTESTSKVTISGFKIFNEAVFIDSLLAEKLPVKLKYNQNFFSVEFSDLSFSNIQQTKSKILLQKGKFKITSYCFPCITVACSEHQKLKHLK